MVYAWKGWHATSQINEPLLTAGLGGVDVIDDCMGPSELFFETTRQEFGGMS